MAAAAVAATANSGSNENDSNSNKPANPVAVVQSEKKQISWDIPSKCMCSGSKCGKMLKHSLKIDVGAQRTAKTNTFAGIGGSFELRKSAGRLWRGSMGEKAENTGVKL